MRIARTAPARAIVLIAIGVLAPATTFAQTGAASLTGIVTDDTGAAVPGATVTATNEATNVTYTAVSNEAANYPVTSLPGSPNTFGTITSTVSSARTVELVLKSFF